ncbi:hypothetical protein [Streptomonospora litoralis]|uniref:Uncharacterized protein n=1 Tax=Streptomonospora litoralis TaxID=2498135 RepID=A0A4P6PUQ7_9ACTN|nr:hypothetical protein [Streptomonospora litoralis]QBI51868.1 hypothetical protein EKD16_00205 [Streptomonospora litoralis]
MNRAACALTVRGYTPPPPPRGDYERVVELTLEHREWDIAYDADNDGRILFQAVHAAAGVAVAARDVRLLAALLRTAEEALR